MLDVPERGEFFTSYDPLPTAPAGRLCAARACTTVLSVYNHKTLCAKHEDERESILDSENFGVQSWALGSVAGAIARKGVPQSSEHAA